MSYRYETEFGGIQALVIDGFENGLADSPYTGIASMKNVNVSWYPGASYVNYKRKATVISGGTMGKPKYYCQSSNSTPTYYILDDQAQVWQSTSPSTSFTLLTGNTTGANKGFGIAYWQNYLFVFGDTFIDVCGNGTGPGGITSGNWANINSSGHYLTNITALSMTAGTTAGQTTITLSAVWPYTTGNYEIKLASNQFVIGTFTNGSATVTVSPAINSTNGTTTIDVHIFPKVANPASAYEHPSIIGFDDVLYFCNGTTLGSILAATGQFFSATSFPTSKFNYGVIKLPLTDVANALCSLGSNILIGGNYAIYPWGAYLNPQPTSFNIPAPVVENISKIINILNTVYVFAGNKGNIYQTNGYQVALLKKIPDSFLGVIDPNWVIGGVMYHRNKLYFGAYGVSQDSSTKMVGVFSLSLTGNNTYSINYESQNSYGVTPTTSNDATNVIIDQNYPISTTSSTIPDSYLTAWYNNSVGGIDYNDTTLWDNHQPMVESDLIPVGTYLQSRTFEDVEYKLDRPLKDSDEIKLYYRTSFTDSYTFIGTTTASSPSFLPLSDNFNSNVNTAQWLQLKATFKCASTSSFCPFREIRIH